MAKKDIREAIRERILVLDGSMGVQIQQLGLGEAEFRGKRFAVSERPQKGNNDLLVLTRPDAIEHIHRSYLEAGADIIETNTFNSNAISQAEYGTVALVPELNRRGAEIARKSADRYMVENLGRSVWVAGSIGPTAVAASLPSDVNDPSRRDVTFDCLREAYREQASALIAGGVDLFLVETIFDILNPKAAIVGIREALEDACVDLPIMLSFTLSDSSGHILSGHDIVAIVTTMSFAEPLALGFNCSFGPEMLLPALQRLAETSPFATIVYPNAGMPDISGKYKVDADSFVKAVKPMLEKRLVNIVGGCCGTGPEHISALRNLVDSDLGPRESRKKQSDGNDSDIHLRGWLSGMKAFDDGMGFINVGERCNVAGSRKFLRLVKEGSWDEACAIARKQIEDGAQIIDINMDDAMLENPATMVKFLRLIGSDPVVASVPWMIDTSDFAVAEAALKEIPGKPIVNSISLKHGEDEFLRHAAIIKKYGASVVVMAFDERGQADTFERKAEICSRAYKLLTEKTGISPRDIVFDPNVLTVATGMEEHNAYGIDFIRAVRFVSENLPGAKTSGGISNLSFAFRGNNYLRQAMHAVFLYHAIEAGLSMAIMDPGAKVTYNDIPADLLCRLEDVVLNRRSDAAERLVEVASEYSDKKPEPTAADVNAGEHLPCGKRIAANIISGDDTTLEENLKEAIAEGFTPSAIVEDFLMDGMMEVGDMFGDGRMFLPQVVKSARVMHHAVRFLQPYMEDSGNSGKEEAGRGTFLLATVRGDVHDIGKNIVGVVLRCNNFRVIDLGVQVEAQTIVEAALREKPDFIGLSGLISPSLGEMASTVRALKEAGISVPVFVGGAATSDLHTAVYIAPEYSGLVARVADAAQNPLLALRIMANPDEEIKKIQNQQSALVESWKQSQGESVSAVNPPIIDWQKESREIVTPKFIGARVLEPVPVHALIPYINWTYFYNAWKVRPESNEAHKIRKDAEELLETFSVNNYGINISVGFFKSYSKDDAVYCELPSGEIVPLQYQRQHNNDKEKEDICLSDFIAPKGYCDYIGAFMITIGKDLRDHLDEPRKAGDDFALILAQSVCDRLVEAASEYVHRLVRTDLWGYSPDEPLDFDMMRKARYRGIRPAIGYPSVPDQRMMFDLIKLVDPDKLSVSVTPNGALFPSSTVAGFYFASPRSRYFVIDNTK